MKVNSSDIIEIMLAAGREHAEQGRHPVAVELFEQALQRLQQLYGKESLRLAPILIELCDCYDILGWELNATQNRSRLSTLLAGCTADGAYSAGRDLNLSIGNAIL